MQGKEFRLNETFRNGAFKMKCEDWGYSIAGWYFILFFDVFKTNSWTKL